MTKIDISKIKPRDQVQVANGDWFTFHGWEGPHAKLGNTGYEDENYYWTVPNGILTAHKPAAAPEPVAEWVTEEEWMPGGKEEYALHHRFSLKHINRLLTTKYGPPPVVKTATGEEEDEGLVLWFADVHDGGPTWDCIHRWNLDPGDRYVELPKCCGEEEA